VPAAGSGELSGEVLAVVDGLVWVVSEGGAVEECLW
jgi:hypothetical protein